MTRYRVTIYVNVGEDNFFGYTARAPLAKVDTFIVEASDPAAAAEAAYSVGNKEAGPDAVGKEYPRDVRSVSVGDLLAIHPRAEGDAGKFFLAVASVGFTDVPEPANPIVALAGSSATSRPAVVNATMISAEELADTGIDPAKLGELVAEAEAGYDVESINPRPNRRLRDQL